VRAAVRDAFVGFTEPFEGRVAWMYLDVRGLVTTGIGNLIDPVAAALALPWQRPDGSRATLNQIQDEWIAVKGRTDMAKRGGGAYAAITSLRLSDAAIDALVSARLDRMVQVLEAAHPCFASLPADAQLAIVSMSWAMGPAFHFPRFWAAVTAGDYKTAAAECTINPQVGTIIRRNDANRRLLISAGEAVRLGLDPDFLHWPSPLAPCSPVVPNAGSTGV